MHKLVRSIAFILFPLPFLLFFQASVSTTQDAIKIGTKMNKQGRFKENS